MLRKILMGLAIGIFIFDILLTGGVMYVRRQYTLPHEMPLADNLQAAVSPTIEAELHGCRAESSGDGSLAARALVPEPRVTFVSTADEATEVSARITNLDASRADIVGAQRIDEDGEPGVLAFTTEVPAGGRKEVKIRRPTGGDGTFTFYVCGDSHGHRHAMDQILTRAEEQKPAFLIELGDIINEPDNPEKLEEALRSKKEYLAGHTVPYLPVLGDDSVRDEAKTAREWKRVFGPSYYSFTYGDAQFIVMDTAEGYISGRQLEWLEERLDEGSDTTHTFVFSHAAVFDPRPGRHHAMVPIISGAPALQNILEEGGVDIAFAGHLHSHTDTERGGVRYIISGGATIDSHKKPPRLHYLAVTLSQNDVQVDVRWLYENPGKRQTARAEPGR